MIVFCLTPICFKNSLNSTCHRLDQITIVIYRFSIGVISGLCAGQGSNSTFEEFYRRNCIISLGFAVYNSSNMTNQRN
ncbi:hypothetical protein G9A89_007407 [Geosiphon pyriformis]|nr:hypothetical protein G9A89_007407 [Geosiphon pyriformis]